MTSKDIFGLIVRITGLVLAVGGLRALPDLPVLKAVLFGIPYSLATLYLLRGAPRLMAFSYPQDKTAAGDEGK